MGGTSGMECAVVPGHGVQFQAITARKLRKLLSPSTAAVAVSLLRGYQEARCSVRAFRADAIIGTGGYAAAATVLAAARSGVPATIVEANVDVGRTNRMLARFSRTVCISWPETAAQLPAGKSALTGLPLRRGITLPPEVGSDEARERLDLDPCRRTLLVLGGSQGARALNTLVIGAVDRLQRRGIQILHQVGAANLEIAREAAARAGVLDLPGYRLVAFLDDTQVPAALRAADLMVCRGGISTLSEALASGTPALVVPLPTAYADHQTRNALAMERSGAAVHRAERSLTAASLAADVEGLFDSPEMLRRMAEAGRTIGRPAAADDVLGRAVAA